MAKLLATLPDNSQIMIEIMAGGAFHDKANVQWDERNDGPIPQIAFDATKLGGLNRSGSTLVFDQAKKDLHDAAIAAKDAVTSDYQTKVAAFRNAAQQIDNISSLAEVKTALKHICRFILLK